MTGISRQLISGWSQRSNEPDGGVQVALSSYLLNFGVTTVLHWLSIGTHRAIYMVFWILYVVFKTTLARLGNSAVAQAFYQLLMSSFFNTFT